jgi:hypothetical protein
MWFISISCTRTMKIRQRIIIEFLIIFVQSWFVCRIVLIAIDLIWSLMSLLRSRVMFFIFFTIFCMIVRRFSFNIFFNFFFSLSLMMKMISLRWFNWDWETIVILLFLRNWAASFFISTKDLMSFYIAVA